jgi:hypothetical protein
MTPLLNHLVVLWRYPDWAWSGPVVNVASGSTDVPRTPTYRRS